MRPRKPEGRRVMPCASPGPPARGEAAAAPPVEARGRAASPSGTRTSETSSGGQMNDIGYLRAPAAERGHAHDRADQVVVGRERQRLDPGSAERAADFCLATPGRLREAAPEAGVVGVDVELLAGLGVLHDQRAHVRQLDLARVEQPDGHDFVPPVEQAERPLPARER